MDILKAIFTDLQNWFQLAGYLIFAILVLVKWLKIDPKKNSDLILMLKNTSDQITLMHKNSDKQTSDMLEKQNQLIAILIRQYSDNLTAEQLNPFIAWLYEAYAFSIYHKLTYLKVDLDSHSIALSEAQIQMGVYIDNNSKELSQTLKIFKYKGKSINTFCDGTVVTKMKEVSNVELSREVNVSRTLSAYDMIVDTAILALIEVIHIRGKESNEKNVNSRG